MGCKIPADMRMIEMLSDQLRVDQAILTGICLFYVKYHLYYWLNAMVEKSSYFCYMSPTDT